MKLFGRMSDKRAEVEVPPELQPYYAVPSHDGVPSLVGLMALAGVLVFVMAALGGWLWQHDRLLSGQQQTSTARSSTQSTPVVPAPAGEPDAVPAQTQPNQSAVSSPQAAASPPANAGAPRTIPSTGAGTTALWLAAVIGITASAAGYVRSLRTTK